MNSFDQKYAELEKQQQGGNYPAVDQLYVELLAYLRAKPASPNTAQVLRSLAFNYAIFLNKHFKDHRKALAMIDLGMQYEPTAVGISVAEAARGEALWGLGDRNGAMAAFKASVKAHPISGRLDTAESFVRIGDPQLVAQAKELLQTLETKYAGALTSHWLASLQATRRALAEKTGHEPPKSLFTRLFGKE